MLLLRTEAQLLERQTYEYLPTGVPGLGLPRGAISEIYGRNTSGKTAFVHNFLAISTQNGEFCALIDAQNAFDPASAAAGKADLRRILWVRCRDAIQALKAADLILHGGGWGVVVLDLGDIRPEMMSKLPISYWHRFRRAVENTPAALVVVEREPFVKNCAATAVEWRRGRPVWSPGLLRALDIAAVPRKGASSRVCLSVHAGAV